MNKLLKSVAILSFFSVLTRLLSFIFKIILSRSISTEILGMYTISLSIFMVMSTMVSSGFPLTISKLTAAYTTQHKKDKLWKSLSCSIILTTSISIVLIFLVIFAKRLFPIFEDNIVYQMVSLSLPAVVFSALYSTFRGYLWGLEKYVSVSIVEIVEQIIRILTFVALFFTTNTMMHAYIPSMSLSIACVLSTIFGIYLFYRCGGRLSKPTKEYSPILKSSIPITSVKTAGSLLPPIMNMLLPSRLMANGYTKQQSLAQLGIYMGMTMSLLSIPSTIIGSLAMALIPQITILHEKENNLALTKQISSALHFTIFCSMICIPVFLSLGTSLCSLIFDNMQAGVYLTHACFLLVPMGISMLTTSMLNSMGQEVKTFQYFMISTIVSIALIYILPQYCGVEAIIYAMGISQILTCVLNLRKLNKLLHFSIPILKPILYQSGIVCIVTICAKLINSLCLYLFPTVITIILVGMVCAISYIMLAICFGQLDVEYIKKSLIKKKTA